ncbi:hypothetical protein ACFQ0B_80330 [Nonomuraea thailandensis]
MRMLTDALAPSSCQAKIVTRIAGARTYDLLTRLQELNKDPPQGDVRLLHSHRAAPAQRLDSDGAAGVHR